MSSKNKFKRLKMITACGMLVALSVILGFIGKTFFTFAGGTVRITFENLPIIFAGICFGPIAGGVVGFLSDLLSCLLAPQPAILPLIMLGAIAVGVVSGIISKYIFKGKRSTASLMISSITSVMVGSVILKTLGICFYYSMPLWETLLIRLALYAVINALEIISLKIIFKNSEINSYINDLSSKR